MSERTAIYRLYDATKRLLYVGITGNLQKRLSEHAASKPWWPEVASHTVAWVESRGRAVDEEQRAIGEEGPVYNVRHAMPSLDDEAADVFARYKQHYEGERRLKSQAMEAADRALEAGASVGQLAEWTGLTPEVFRRRARALGVERKRPPTVEKLGASADLPGVEKEH